MSQPTLSIATKEATATIALLGGGLTSYHLGLAENRFDILCPTLTPGDKPASFPLIPYSNRVKHGRFDFAGNTYTLPLNFGDHPHSIHGVASKLLWQLQEQTDTKVTLKLDYKKADWPFDFSALQTFELEGQNLRHAISLTNTSGEPMPAGLGMHPYFPRHQQAHLRADVSHVWLTDDTCLPLNLVPCPKEWDLRDGVEVEKLLCDNQFEPWGGQAHITWPKDKMAVDLTSSEDLNRLVVYAPEGQDFFCVEPVTHMTDAFNHTANGMTKAQTGMRVLAPGETWNVWMKFSPWDLTATKYLFRAEILLESLEELSSRKLQEDLWVNGTPGYMSTFIEAYSCLFDDAGLSKAMDKGELEEHFSPMTCKKVNELDKLLRDISKGDDGDPIKIIENPHMEIVRSLSGELLALFKNELKIET